MAEHCKVRVRFQKDAGEPDLLGLFARVRALGEVRDLKVEFPGPETLDLLLEVVPHEGVRAQELSALLASESGVTAYEVSPVGEEARPAASGDVGREMAREILNQQLEFLETCGESADFPQRLPALLAVLEGLAASSGNTKALEMARFLREHPEEATREAILLLFEALAAALGVSLRFSAARSAAERPPEVRERFAEVREPGRGIRIDEAKAENLFALAGELVVVTNAFAYLAQRAESGLAREEFVRALREQNTALARLCRSLQDAVMGLRLLPARHVFQKFPRMVRDLARELGKKVRLELVGEEIEFDKAVLQAVGEPLVHLVRNALDHGLEPPEERRKVGKPEEGLLVLRAGREGTKVFLEVADDGAGVDLEAVREKAVERGLVAPEKALHLTPEEVLEFLFVPGFSTSPRVSAVSGRGVGLDAVRAVVRRMGGEVHLFTERGAGTRVVLELPLTLATARVLLVRQGGQRFGIPFAEVREMVRIPWGAFASLRRQRVVTIRGEILPVALLGEVLAAGGREEGAAEEEACLVVLEAGYVLAVDGFAGQEEVVLKPLPAGLGVPPCFAGAAILGDGSILLVLDPNRLFTSRREGR